MSTAQQSDPSLHKCFIPAVSQEVAKKEKTAYFVDDGLLMRKWCANDADGDWSSAFQIVVPVEYRAQVLRLAHDHQLAGHLGVTKTYDRILLNFFLARFKKRCV